ncbi:MAG: tyrosine-type recombinase/integrase [Gammaproteobacteria bacterium]
MRLSDIKVRKAAPREKAYKLSDGHGLHLLVKPNGGKYWRLQYRVDGKQKVLALGVYPEVSLAEARDKQADARKLLRNGQDPAEVKREQKRQAKMQAENSFENVAREWHSNQKGRWTADHAHRVITSLEKDIFPHLGTKPIHDVTAPILLQALRRIEKRDALDYSSRVLQRVSAVFRYATSTGLLTYNPAADLVGSLKRRKLTHRAALSRADLPEFFDRLRKYDGEPITRLGLRLIVLTFVRSRELRGARWDEFDLDRSEWRIPAERMKITAEHIVPLSRQTIAVLDELKPLTGSYDLVFPGRSNLSKPISENTFLYAMYRMGYHSKATVHGFRATASTILNEMGFKPDVIERQLAHAERNKVRAAYHRSEYLEDRRKMMQAWADYLDSLETGAKVIPLHAR